MSCLIDVPGGGSVLSEGRWMGHESRGEGKWQEEIGGNRGRRNCSREQHMREKIYRRLK